MNRERYKVAYATYRSVRDLDLQPEWLILRFQRRRLWRVLRGEVAPATRAEHDLVAVADMCTNYAPSKHCLMPCIDGLYVSYQRVARQLYGLFPKPHQPNWYVDDLKTRYASYKYLGASRLP